MGHSAVELIHRECVMCIISYIISEIFDAPITKRT